jgi:hypothetical protein
VAFGFDERVRGAQIKASRIQYDTLIATSVAYGSEGFVFALAQPAVYRALPLAAGAAVLDEEGRVLSFVPSRAVDVGPYRAQEGKGVALSRCGKVATLTLAADATVRGVVLPKGTRLETDAIDVAKAGRCGDEPTVRYLCTNGSLTIGAQTYGAGRYLTLDPKQPGLVVSRDGPGC